MAIDRTFLNGFLGGVFFVLIVGGAFVAGTFFSVPALKVEAPGANPPAAGTNPGGATQPSVPGPAQQGGAEDPIPSRGPQGAKVTLTEFADFHCGFCRKVAPTLLKVMENYKGNVRWAFRHFPLGDVPGEGSFLTHEAAACAQEQGKFWEFHDAIFSFPGVPKRADLSGIAKSIGLDTNGFEACLSSGKYQDFIKEEQSAGVRKDVSGTPTIFVNDYRVSGAQGYPYFEKVINAILDPKNAALPEGLEVDKAGNDGSDDNDKENAKKEEEKKVSFDDLEGRPSVGPKDAPITLVEFGDFHCPFCAKVSPTLQQLMGNYDGKIRRVYRHYPLSFHEGADRTHQATECAQEQGKFWEFYNGIFASKSPTYDDAWLEGVSKSAGLDNKKFKKCLESGKYKDVVEKDIAKGNEVGVRGTPAVFVNGKLISGAHPYKTFEQAVLSELNKS